MGESKVPTTLLEFRRAFPDDAAFARRVPVPHSLGEILLDSPTLVVRSAALKQLLAMKLRAWRDDVDIEDARLLLGKLGDNRDLVWALVEPHLVPGRELKARLAFEDLWESEHGPA